MRILLGLVTWAMDVIKHTVDEMFELSEQYTSGTLDRDALTNLSPSTPGSLTLLLLTSSMPRAFFKYNCRVLRGLHGQYRQIASLALPPGCIHLFNKINATVDESPVTPALFEKLIFNMEKVIQHTYSNAGLTGADRARAERDMLLTGKIPDVLVPAVENLLLSIVPDLAKDIDRQDLYFLDYEWLKLGDDGTPTATNRPTTPMIDMFKKIPVSPDAKTLRRCVRCCEVSEDVGPPERGTPAWLANLLKTCSCGSFWRIEGVGKK